MSPELDVPLTPSADQIRRREFVTVRRGYDPDQVRQYLDRVADEVEVLEENLRSARGSSASRETPAEAAVEPAPAEDRYTELTGHMAELLRNAEAAAAQIREEAEGERDRMLAEARAEADRITTDAQGHAEGLRNQAEMLSRQAQQESDRMLSDLDGQRESLVRELQEMRDRLLGMAQSLGAFAAGHEAPRGSAATSQPASQPAPEPEQDPRYAQMWDEEPAPGQAQPVIEEPNVGLPQPPSSEPPSSEPPMASASGPTQPDSTAPLFRMEAEASRTIEVPELAKAEIDPLERLFADIPTLSLDDLDPGEFDF